MKLEIFGNHDQQTIDQAKNCMNNEYAIRGVLCADGHLGYSQPVGCAIAYKDHISVSGVGYDIGCGNLAVKTDIKFNDIAINVLDIAKDISKKISFGVGRTNQTPVDHELFSMNDLWKDAEANDYKDKAYSQLGTVGSGNHYVDLFEDRESGYVWIGIHFGSRGLGHTLATKYLKLGGGKDGIHQPPTLLNINTDLGRAYLAAMKLSGMYAYAGREWVAKTILNEILHCKGVEYIHNHHNYAWEETVDGETAWVVRKGCTPAYPSQGGFVGGSMGDDAVILQGAPNTEKMDKALYSTVHGAGRILGRNVAKKTLSRGQMDQWLRNRGVTLIGGDLDESPMAYRRLEEVLAEHSETITIKNILRPFIVVMAGKDIKDPFKD